MTMHCVYCGATIPVTRIVYASAPADEQVRRLAFETEHEARCGEKAVAIIGEVA